MSSPYRLKQDPSMTVNAEVFDGTVLPALIDVDGDNTATNATVGPDDAPDGERTLTLDTQTVIDGSTLYARMTARADDLVVQNTAGEVFTVPADLFATLYEPVPPDGDGA